MSHTTPTHRTHTMTTSHEPTDPGSFSDGYHTMDELYEYRMLYNALAVSNVPRDSVKSWRHHDGELCFGGGWFVVYTTLPTGQISNHYPAADWDLFQVPEVERAPEWDGHDPAEVARRIREALSSTSAPVRNVLIHYVSGFDTNGVLVTCPVDQIKPNLVKLVKADAVRAARSEGTGESDEEAVAFMWDIVRTQILPDVPDPSEETMALAYMGLLDQVDALDAYEGTTEFTGPIGDEWCVTIIPAPNPGEPVIL